MHITISGHTIPVDDLAHADHLRAIAADIDDQDQLERWLYAGAPADHMTGAALQRLREKMKLNQTQLSEKLGLSRDGIARMESGKILIRPVIRMAIEHLGCKARKLK